MARMKRTSADNLHSTQVIKYPYTCPDGVVLPDENALIAELVGPPGTRGNRRDMMRYYRISLMLLHELLTKGEAMRAVGTLK